MIRESYRDLINYVSHRAGVSYNRAWTVLKEYSTVLKDAIRRGDAVNISGLVEISFTTTEGYIYKNKRYMLEEQLEDICKRLDVDEMEVKNIVLLYVKRIKERVLDGYQVNLKGICYLLPKEYEDGDVTCLPRVSPVLEKPELVDYVLSTEEGMVFMELSDKSLRFKIDIHPDLELLRGVATIDQRKELELKKIDV